jgi:hypothetical protein
MVSIDDGDEGQHVTTEIETKDSWNWGEHIALLITGFSALVVGVRILSVAGQNYENAYGILQANGTATVIASTLIPAIGFTALPLAILIGAMLGRGQLIGSSRPFTVALVVFLALVSIVTTPILFYFSVIAWAIVVLPASKLASKFTKSKSGKIGEATTWSRNKLRSPDFALSLLAAGGVLLFFVFVSNDIPWVPAEKIALTNTRPFTGYVFGETDTDVTILSADTHQIIHISPGQITSRSVCQPSGVIYGGIILETLSELIGGHNNSNYPACPR